MKTTPLTLTMAVIAVCLLLIVIAWNFRQRKVRLSFFSKVEALKGTRFLVAMKAGHYGHYLLKRNGKSAYPGYFSGIRFFKNPRLIYLRCRKKHLFLNKRRKVIVSFSLELDNEVLDIKKVNGSWYVIFKDSHTSTLRHISENKDILSPSESSTEIYFYGGRFVLVTNSFFSSIYDLQGNYFGSINKPRCYPVKNPAKGVWCVSYKHYASDMHLYNYFDGEKFLLDWYGICKKQGSFILLSNLYLQGLVYKGKFIASMADIYFLKGYAVVSHEYESYLTDGVRKFLYSKQRYELKKLGRNRAILYFEGENFPYKLVDFDMNVLFESDNEISKCVNLYTTVKGENDITFNRNGKIKS